MITAPETVQERIGLILPLTGPMASIGARMRDAAQLALPADKGVILDVYDETQEGGPVKAASNAVKAGDKIVLGPITSGSTEKVADVLQVSNVPELAFTSDIRQARPGVWVMGLTPEQQVNRLVESALSEGRKSFAAFLPDNALGHAMGEALAAICQKKGLNVPQVVYHTDNIDSINGSFETLLDIKNDPNADAKPQENTQPSAIDPLGGDISEKTDDSKKPLKPAFDALLLGDTGLNLGHIINILQKYDISTSKVRIMGPMLWKAFDGKLGALKGAWYPAFDDRQRGRYIQKYVEVYHTQPSPVTDFAYDAAALAGALTREHKLDKANLTRKNGFMGLNGTFWLKENGHVKRNLVIYQILPGGGARMIVPKASGSHQKK
ncbi:ABC transporter substrate-binding protein [Aristophania vespae]|uniref:ABC transporter substrate-binding protein n=1 Tax=Aristophania vespae TaxID=2697033 RepID=A0A6P1NDS8_9PROT|nr:penicillin-binding protein activator [Aristophania vespae]QHI95639.1 ABC transporter substrate-binding protein [Aristophania vespae]